jgi:hypothetical protein
MFSPDAEPSRKERGHRGVRPCHPSRSAARRAGAGSSSGLEPRLFRSPSRRCATKPTRLAASEPCGRLPPAHLDEPLPLAVLPQQGPRLRQRVEVCESVAIGRFTKNVDFDPPRDRENDHEQHATREDLQRLPPVCSRPRLGRDLGLFDFHATILSPWPPAPLTRAHQRKLPGLEHGKITRESRHKTASFQSSLGAYGVSCRARALAN